MYKKIICFMLFLCCMTVLFTGCTDKESKDNTYVGPAYCTSLEEIPSGTYFIAHEQGEDTYYYPFYYAEASFSESLTDVPRREDPSRFFWVCDNIDEVFIPTLYKGDKILYKSDVNVPENYFLERFKDEGYTLGIAGLANTPSGNYQYIPDSSYLKTNSDTAGFASLSADSIFLVSLDDVLLSKYNVSDGGFVTNLEKDKVYNADVRNGTEKVTASFTANTHLFSYMENYLTRTYTFINEHVIEIQYEMQMNTGYYSINNAGFFRYCEDTEDITKLTAFDYNKPYYLYDIEGNLASTIDGKVLNDESLLVEPSEIENTDYYEYENNENLEDSESDDEDIDSHTKEPEVVIDSGTKSEENERGVADEKEDE